ncbi:MAG: amidase [Janthinobacterium lividum]
MPYPAPDPVLALPAATANAPLQGLTFAVKDVIDVAGYPTGNGNPHSLAMSGLKTVSAAVVTSLAAAGATFVGKVTTDELAFSMSGRNTHYGTPLNGAAPKRIPGGSSSGSASAVSNGLADFALGTDTGGSLRAPASHCGLIGLRPSPGRLCMAGITGLAPTFDACGWLARDIGTFARVGQVLLGPDTAALGALPRVLVPEDVLELLQPRVQSLFARTLQKIAGVLPVATAVTAAVPSFDTLYWAFRVIQGYQAWQLHGAAITRHGMQLGPGIRERFEWASHISAAQMAEHSAVRLRFMDDFASLMGANTVMLLPTMPDIAPLLSASDAALEEYRNAATRLLCLAVLSGFAQLSLPLMQLEGAPLGLSLIGPPGSDLALIELGRQLMATQPCQQPMR